MRILYVAMRYDYGDPEQGCSFEHHNFYESLASMGHELLYFDFATALEARGREAMNRRLREIAKAERPELMFTVLFRDELDPDVVGEISRGDDTVTLNWFCDDHWRFDGYSRHWAPRFDHVVTTAASALPKYARLGLDNVIKSQWACNHLLYRRLDLEPRYDVTFVGRPHGDRPQVIQALRDAGIEVHVRGTGWEGGRVGQEEMIELFNRSRIVLNLANASTPQLGRLARLRRSTRQQAARHAARLPVGSRVKALGRRVLVPSPGGSDGRATATIYPGQIKARNFEVPGCGSFLLTEPAENLEEYYRDGDEVVCFESVDDLVEKIRYHLDREDERARIAAAGYERTLREHTYAHRFAEIFRTIGLDASSPAPAARGETIEVT